MEYETGCAESTIFAPATFTSHTFSSPRQLLSCVRRFLASSWNAMSCDCVLLPGS